MLILVVLIGLISGSFLGALTYRSPRRISIAKGRSFCPKCKKTIAWYDNVPLLSFIFLGGKCRNCKKPISRRYPAIELSTALGFVAIGYYATTFKGLSFKGTPNIIGLFVSLALFLILFSIFIIDLEHQIIPDSFVFWGIFVVFLYTIYYIPYTFFPSLFAGFIAATLLLLIHLITKGRGMGLGDVKFAVLGGLIVGLRLLPIWLFLAFLTGAIVGIILILGKKAHLKSQIAFGPFLIFAIPPAMLVGERIIAWLNI